ncbi:13044_t:CDS:2, partial [Dentiscutata erythropus]
LLYPQQYIFKDHELRAWRALLKAASCHEITLFTNNKSKIAHSIKRYVHLEYNIQNGNDIVDTIRDIKGTSVANINSSERPKKAKKIISTLEGITNWSHFVWPTSSELSGYICARSLPNFGS